MSAEAAASKRPREEEEAAAAAAATEGSAGAAPGEGDAAGEAEGGAGGESPSKKKLKSAEEAAAATTAAAADDDDEEDVMASIIQKQKELEEAKARAAQKLNQKLGAPVVNVNTITTATTNPAGAVAGSGSGTAAATGARAAPGAGGAPSANPGAAGAGGPPAAPFKKPEVDNINRIYVGSLHYDLKDEDIRKVFAPFGPIREIVMSHDPVTGRSKGFCFVDFTTPESAAMALQTMNGFQLAGRPIRVGRPTAGQGSNNPVLKAVAPFALPGGGFGGAPRPGYVPGQPKIPPGNQNARIYVGSIAFEVAVDVVKRLFESFGAIRSCTLLPDPNNPSRLHRGYGFIEFETEAAAQQALQTMNGFELYGRQMKVGPANPGAAMAGGGAAGAGAGGMGMGGAMGGWQQYPPQQQQWAGQQQWGQPAAGAQGAWGMQQPQAGGYGAVAGQQGAQPQQWAQWGQQAGGQQAGGQQQQQWTGY